MGAPFCCRSATAQGGIELVDVPVPSAARALRPLSPLHGDVCAAADGAIEAHRVRRSRASNGWRGQVDLPGEGRELWQTMLVPLMPGLGPWDCTGSQLVLDAALLAAIPAGSALSVQQVGDFRLSPPPLMGRWQPRPKPLPRAIAGSWMEPRPGRRIRMDCTHCYCESRRRGNDRPGSACGNRRAACAYGGAWYYDR